MKKQSSSDQATKWLIYEPAKTVITRIMPELATEIGLNESIVLLQISFWISISNNIENERYWTYQTLGDMQKRAFPYWSIDTIRRTLHSLRDQGYILIDNFNKRKGDNTQWFTLEPDKCSSLKSIYVMPESKIAKDYPPSILPVPPLQNATTPLQNRTTLPEITTETTHIKDIAHSAQSSESSPNKKQKPLPLNKNRWGWDEIEIYATRHPDLDGLVKQSTLATKVSELPTKYVALDAIELSEALTRQQIALESIETLISMAKATKSTYNIFRKMLYALPAWLETRQKQATESQPDNKPFLFSEM